MKPIEIELTTRHNYGHTHLASFRSMFGYSNWRRERIVVVGVNPDVWINITPVREYHYNCWLTVRT